MKYSVSITSLAIALPAVQGIAFGGPASTAIIAGLAPRGTSPKPTVAPTREDMKRRQTNLYPETCGWVDGVYSLSVTCPGSRTCMLYTAGAGMAGCCDGTNTQECGWATSCVDARAYRASSCGSSCLLNTLIRKCTETTAPHCITFSYPSDSILYYGCDADSDSIVSSVLQHATDEVGGTTSMALPTVAANPVITDPNSDKTTNKTRKIAIGLLVGIVVVALFVVACIAIGTLFFLKKKQRRIAANAQSTAAVQATGSESQYPPPQQAYQYPQQQPVAQTQSYQASLFRPPSNPPTTTPSYFPPGLHEEKPGTHTTVHEYAVTPVSPPISPPISGRPTPAPVYSQPYNAPPPTPVVNQYQANAEAHEVDAISVPHAPNQTGPVHEIGTGK
ncbi:uncharacterized protein M421DRAFT_418568 [Didymella exigua CBS 183.55]|uniref:Mid2 domain-containing protein n=1 Tax=Didymella exigua CBS 183.55 TaxID=1150837 RepID=A0A6A5RSC6_9PLEO|nr:uncharacterized protein M421DRAFT_418568 [Didymella exigua CBS 183.55]KAF1930250.1 hypothetical protein M421DRAFT_418568 [Didymella exigua CBS 183.55]